MCIYLGVSLFFLIFFPLFTYVQIQIQIDEITRAGGALSCMGPAETRTSVLGEVVRFFLMILAEPDSGPFFVSISPLAMLLLFRCKFRAANQHAG